MSAAARPPSSSPYFLITAQGNPSAPCRRCTSSAQPMTRFTSPVGGAPSGGAAHRVVSVLDMVQCPARVCGTAVCIASGALAAVAQLQQSSTELGRDVQEACAHVPSRPSHTVPPRCPALGPAEKSIRVSARLAEGRPPSPDGRESLHHWPQWSGLHRIFDEA